MPWSIISSAAGMIPAPMMSLIALVASSTESNTPSIVRQPCGLRVSRTQILVTMPSVPSLPTIAPTRSEPGGIFARPAELHDLAVGQ